MKSLMNILVKGLAGLLFVALVAVNVQVGTGNNLWGDGSSVFKVDQAKADYCNPAPQYCTIDIFGNIIWGIKHDGFPNKQ